MKFSEHVQKAQEKSVVETPLKQKDDLQKKFSEKNFFTKQKKSKFLENKFIKKIKRFFSTSLLSSSNSSSPFNQWPAKLKSIRILKKKKMTKYPFEFKKEVVIKFPEPTKDKPNDYLFVYDSEYDSMCRNNNSKDLYKLETVFTPPEKTNFSNFKFSSFFENFATFHFRAMVRKRHLNSRLKLVSSASFISRAYSTGK